MVTLVKENTQTGQMDKTAYQLRLLQEAIVNKYVDVVKSETGITNNDIEINMPDDSKMTEEKHNSCTESVKDSKEKEIVRRTVEIKDDSDDLKFIDLK